MYEFIFVFIHKHTYIFLVLGIAHPPQKTQIRPERGLVSTYNDDDVYLDILQTRGVKKTILYM
jgi:hypothetical protein